MMIGIEWVRGDGWAGPGPEVEVAVAGPKEVGEGVLALEPDDGELDVVDESPGGETEGTACTGGWTAACEGLCSVGGLWSLDVCAFFLSLAVLLVDVD